MQTRKLALALVAFVLLGCCAIGALTLVIVRNTSDDMIITDEQRAAAIGQEIVAYELPPGYHEQMASNIVYKMVFIASDDNAMTIMLMGFPAMGATTEEMRQQVETSLNQQTSSGGVIWEPAGEREVVIRGEPVTLAVQEGRASNGRTMRREMGAFAGEHGLVMLAFFGAERGWDDEGVDAFIASLR